MGYSRLRLWLEGKGKGKGWDESGIPIWRLELRFQLSSEVDDDLEIQETRVFLPAS